MTPVVTAAIATAGTMAVTGAAEVVKGQVAATLAPTPSQPFLLCTLHQMRQLGRLLGYERVWPGTKEGIARHEADRLKILNKQKALCGVTGKGVEGGAAITDLEFQTRLDKMCAAEDQALEPDTLEAVFKKVREAAVTVDTNPGKGPTVDTNLGTGSGAGRQKSTTPEGTGAKRG